MARPVQEVVVLVFGVILIVLAAVFGGVSFYNKKLVYSLRVVDKRNASDVLEIANDIRAEMAEFGGSEMLVHEIGEFVGDIRCDQPLSAELSGQQCVYYKMTVTRRYEESYWDKDANEWKTRNGTSTVSSNSRCASFVLDDGTAQLPVDADGASWDGLEQTVSKFEPSGFAPEISFGGFRLRLGGDHHDTNERRTVGFEYKEHIMPVGKRITAIGEVNDKMGQVALRKGEKQKLRISTRSREEQVASAQKAQKGFFFAAIGCGVLGVILAIVGAIT